MDEFGESYPGRAWISAHLYYYEPLDNLLDHLVSPLLDQMRDSGLIRRHFYIRYWRGGPHIRLRLQPVNGAYDDVVRSLCAHAHRFFQAKPSHGNWTPETQAQIAKLLSRVEPDI